MSIPVSPKTIERAILESQTDSIAVTELATILAKDWCAGLGGWPTDTTDRMLQVWAFRPEARKLLAAMNRVPKENRRALGTALLSRSCGL